MAAKLKHVYCYRMGAGNCYKVGWTKNLPETRMRGFSTGSPVKPKLYRDIPTENPSGVENYIHQLLSPKRAENGEFFYVDEQELNEAVDKAVAFVTELQPLEREAAELSRKRPTDTVVEAPDEMRELNRQLLAFRREKFLIDQQIAFLQCKIKVAIGENLGMKGIASWGWVERKALDIDRFQTEEEALYQTLCEKYPRDSSSRRFTLEREDPSQADS